MYHEFYQLKENPFNVTADPDFFFPSQIHDEVIAILQYGISERKGIFVVTGEIGTGKTTLCRKLIRQFDHATKFALILNPNFSDIQLLQMIVQDLGLRGKKNNKFALIQQLNAFLLEESAKGNNVVVIIDEAQHLGVSQLEQIRLLSNLETEKEKLLQLILVGQPELHFKLELTALRQLRQRIALHLHLKPLEKDAIKAYINHRLDKAFTANKAQPIIFTDQAIEAIFHFTKGTPRTINLLCDRVLLAGFIRETHQIDKNIIETCAREILYCEYNL
jgi:general secretion pathway protein A